VNTKVPGVVPELKEGERWFRCNSLEEALGIIQGLEHLQHAPSYTLKKFSGSRESTWPAPRRGVFGLGWRAPPRTIHETWWEIIAHGEDGP